MPISQVPEPNRMTADEWNAAHPVGAAVIVKRDNGRLEYRKTRSAAWNLGHGQPVVMLEGISGGYALERVLPAPTAHMPLA
jgi:hypothetical protein